MMPAPDCPGGLLYVMGPSGAGKDALLAYARKRIDPARTVFAHRYITRPADIGGENHIALSTAEFQNRRAAGIFALSWESHGFLYGVGIEIDLWQRRGFLVVVSGARAIWPQAKARYPALRGLVIDAPIALRAERLAMRGREDAIAIRERLERNIDLPSDDGIRWLDNSGPITSAGEALVTIIDEISGVGIEAHESIDESLRRGEAWRVR